jgi:hypothetical protein
MSTAPPPGLTARQARAIAAVAARAQGPALPRGLRVTLHFHPDAPVGPSHAAARTFVLAALGREGRYRSQFETGTSNGGLTAHPGGDRWRWESRIFDGAYDDGPSHERPVYGALDFRGRVYGAAPRFGSAFLRLRAHTLERTTFCFPDSVFEPAHFGTSARMGLLSLAASADHDRLDEYIEAQVHGPVELERDVEALVLDPCYRGTPVEACARALPCALEWHPGYRLHGGAFERLAEYRGPEVAALGGALAETGDGWLTPASLGHARRAGAHDPQHLKKVWHCLARFGAMDESA